MTLISKPRLVILLRGLNLTTNRTAANSFPYGDQPNSYASKYRVFKNIVTIIMTDEISEYGWTAVPRDIEKLLKGRKNIRDPKPIRVSDIEVPATSLAREIQQYAKTNLPEETYNHSMRVYFYGKLPIDSSTTLQVTMTPRRLVERSGLILLGFF